MGWVGVGRLLLCWELVVMCWELLELIRECWSWFNMNKSGSVLEVEWSGVGWSVENGAWRVESGEWSRVE